MFAVVHTSYYKRRFTLWLPRREKVEFHSVFNEIFTNDCGLQYARPVRPDVPGPNKNSSNVS